MGLPQEGNDRLQIITGSTTVGIKLAGTAKPSGTSSSLSTTATKVTFDTAVFPAPATNTDKNPTRRPGKIPKTLMCRAVGGTLILNYSGGTVTLADGIWTPVPLFVHDLWEGRSSLFVSSGGTSALEYIIGYTEV